MNNSYWRTFFITCAHVCGAGAQDINLSQNWCSWTTFTRLAEDAGYWQSDLPHVDELGEESTFDGGTWGQPFPYNDIAHLIVPKTFTKELFTGPAEKRVFERVSVSQDIESVSKELSKLGVPHTLSSVALEVKIF